MDIQFDGQQSDEKILSVITPHSSRFILSFLTTTTVLLFIVVILWAVSSLLPTFSTAVKSIGTIICLAIYGLSIWWLVRTQTEDKTYITDRRIIRFDVVTPFFTNKRALFWNEVLKVKAYATNMILRLCKIGVLQIEPVAAEHESIIIPDVYYHEDLANYIDKVLFTFKNKPEDITQISPFVPKPRGQRG